MVARGLKQDFYICGGAALIALGVVSRSTNDVDLLLPKINAEMKAAIAAMAEKLGLSDGWVNNGPDDMVEYLDQGWRERCTQIFSGQALKVFCLSRQELLNTKLWAACDRIDDVPDILAMSPSEDELAVARQWVLRCDGASLWAEIVDQCVAHIGKRLADG